MLKVNFEKNKPLDLEAESLDFLCSLNPEQQEIITDSVDRLVDLIRDANERNIELTEADTTEILLRAFALNIYLIDKKANELINAEQTQTQSPS